MSSGFSLVSGIHSGDDARVHHVALLVRLLDRLLRAEDGDLEVGLAQLLREGLEALARRADHLVAGALPRCSQAQKRAARNACCA